MLSAGAPRHQVCGPARRPSRALALRLAGDALDLEVLTEAPLDLVGSKRRREEGDEMLPPAHVILETPQQVPTARMAQREQGFCIPVTGSGREVVERAVVHQEVEGA